MMNWFIGWFGRINVYNELIYWFIGRINVYDD